MQACKLLFFLFLVFFFKMVRCFEDSSEGDRLNSYFRPPLYTSVPFVLLVPYVGVILEIAASS
jgi:hypothetical protein